MIHSPPHLMSPSCPMHTRNHQHPHFATPQGNSVPPILPLGLPQPQFAPQFPHAHLLPHPQYSQPPLHPQYAQLPPMMLNPYGQLQVYVL